MAIGPAQSQSKTPHVTPQRWLILAAVLLASTSVLSTELGLARSYAVGGLLLSATAVTVAGLPVPSLPQSTRMAAILLTLVVFTGAAVGWGAATGWNKIQIESRGHVRDEAFNSSVPLDQANIRYPLGPVMPPARFGDSTGGKGGGPAYSMDIKPIGQSLIKIHTRLQA